MTVLYDVHNVENIMGYHPQGDLLEVYDCNTLYPCWIGEDSARTPTMAPAAAPWPTGSRAERSTAWMPRA